MADLMDSVGSIIQRLHVSEQKWRLRLRYILLFTLSLIITVLVSVASAAPVSNVVPGDLSVNLVENLTPQQLEELLRIFSAGGISLLWSSPFWGFVSVLFLTGLLKKFIGPLHGRWVVLTSLASGVGFSALGKLIGYQPIAPWTEVLVAGLSYGIAASGGYDVFLDVLRKALSLKAQIPTKVDAEIDVSKGVEDTLNDVVDGVTDAVKPKPKPQPSTSVVVGGEKPSIQEDKPAPAPTKPAPAPPVQEEPEPVSESQDSSADVGLPKPPPRTE